MPGDDALTAPMPGADHQTFGPVEIDVTTVGDARIRRCTYPPGMRWSTDLKPRLGTDLCEHAHAGFLAAGALTYVYADGCEVALVAPAVVDVAPHHDAFVVGDGPAIVIEIDFLGDTVARMGLAAEHVH
ncbi:MAG TPA: hypothetical protein VGO60_00970 [Iamia sp.]|jgi:hypothetical protein|nr:hypothetical protein [Iamia sp.]